MFAFWKKGEQARELILQHVDQVQQAMRLFAQATRAYFVEKDTADALRLMHETHKAESAADDVRREVERAMVSGALLAPSRRQFLLLVDHVDSLANAAQDTLHYLIGQSVEVPSELESPLLDILAETEALFGQVEQGIRSLLAERNGDALSCAERIDQHESTVDRFETRATKALFSLDIDLAKKLHVYGYMERLVEISDRAEDLADQMALVAAERAL